MPLWPCQANLIGEGSSGGSINSVVSSSNTSPLQGSASEGTNSPSTESVVTVSAEPAVFEDSYRLENVIGSGSYSSVFRCVCRRTGENFAVKVIDEKQLSSYQRQLIRNEEDILRRLDHPNIIRLVGVFAIEAAARRLMVLEFADQLDVCLALVTSPGFGEAAVKSAARQLAEGLHYMHVQGIVHRDLKLENLLVKSGAKAGEMVLKICDFGYAVRLTDGQTFFTMKNTIIGSFEYMSPELISNQEYSAKIDCWAAGVIVYFLFTGDFPFKGATVTDMARCIVKRQFTLDFTAPEWAAASPYAVDFVRRILEPLYTRPTAKELLRHPWLTASPDDPRNRPGDLPLPFMLQHERLEFLQHEAEAKLKRLYNNSSSGRAIGCLSGGGGIIAESPYRRSRCWRRAQEDVLASELSTAASAANHTAWRRCRSQSIRHAN